MTPEIPLTLVLHRLELLACLLEALLVLLKEPLAFANTVDKLDTRYFPDLVVAFAYVLLAGVYHLIRDLEKE